jgi:ATP-dependent RNA helicase SUPV3L1/SUV3
LESATSGIYAGPLRLLAHEVYSRLNALGKPCNLVTGDERIVVDSENVNLVSCTVEMVPVRKPVEVAVVDEIQMIAHEQRGWAWAQALLGIQARELHLCGEERVVPLIRALTAAMGDQLEIHNYQRLNPLKTMSTSLNGDLTKLRKGDCVVSFSRLQIHALRMEIEKITGRKVAVVYGSLPPEIRAQQAKLFNDPTNDYDFLVASDAIGMGLNLWVWLEVFSKND